ncbi:MAG: right-handed parallel beta-helix repeat-containing protein [Actinobacteria bacterium]|nr:right-handed parallel beta-helix repeat-containing protein [Actinomycetota bacterium]
MFSTLWQKLFSGPRAPRRPSAARRQRPRLESLEDRWAPAVLTVNTLADATDHAHLDLREAITAVDSGSTAGLSAQQKHQVHGSLGHHDTIKFASGLHGTITLAQGELDITRAVKVAGPGASQLTLDAHQQSRVFDVSTAGIAVTLSGLTITNGDANGGGGIYNAGKLTVSNSTVSSNDVSVFFVPGGGIYNATGATLTVSQSTIDGNIARDGGGIFNAGTLTVSDSTISHNIATPRVANAGGGIENTGTLTMTDSTLYGNRAVVGGGLYSSGTASLTSVTVTANTAVVSGSYTAGAGLDVAGGTLLLHNSIVAGNTFFSSSFASDIAGTVSSASSYDLIGTGGSGGLVNGTNHNQVGVSNPGLGSLANNGGPTETVALLTGSPAIDTGDPALLHTKDQRGVVRKGHVSIGAFQQN